jgi:hypothetical protein
MKYQAGLRGFAALGMPDREPGWHCTCQQWIFPAVPMPRRIAGNNLIEAKKAHAAHVTFAGHDRHGH